jgi:CDP-diacylglycerol--glycerol-3-phosphate 3-phosphatidyltransferase
MTKSKALVRINHVQNNTNIGQDEWEIDNLPNRLTLFRVLLIPVVIACLYATTWPLSSTLTKALCYIAAWTFVAASITDFFDGHIARKRKIVTVLGSFLDPIADKFLVVSSLIMLLGIGRVPAVMVIVLVLREMYITALRLLAGERGIQVPVSTLGKWKTTFQMIGIPFLMAYDRPWGIPMPEIGLGFLWVATLFSVYSAFEYSLGLIGKFKLARARARAQKKGLL